MTTTLIITIIVALLCGFLVGIWLAGRWADQDMDQIMGTGVDPEENEQPGSKLRVKSTYPPEK